MVALHVLYGYDTQYKLDKLPELGELVSRISKFPTAVEQADSGRPQLHARIRHRRRPGGEGAAGDVRHASGVDGPQRRSGARQEERQGVDHLQPGTARHHRCRR